MRVAITWRCVWVGIALSACAGELEHPERFALVVSCDDPADFVRRTCGDDGCHAPASPLGLVDLRSPDAGPRLIGQPPALCTDGILVDPTDPARSLLLDKLSDHPSCGARMPFTRPRLGVSQRACVERFVNQLLGVADPDAGTPDASTMDAVTP